MLRRTAEGSRATSKPATVAFPEVMEARVVSIFNCGRFTRAVGPEKAKHLALVHGKRNIVDGFCFRWIELGEVFCQDDGGHFCGN